MLDYKKLNFKCGLELHVQLESPKLFCRCPTLIDNDKPDLIIKRKLRAVAGLAGEKDIAALFEEQRNRTFHYEYSNRYACLIDLDSEPPISINQKSLNTALEISLLLNAKIEPKIVVQRKIVVDGSNPGGFQRTTLIATDGKVKTSKGIVRIPTILLEEDAARKIEDKGSEVIYRLDRLGFPLIEVGTSPDIKDPDHAKETAETLGMILKSTGKIKKGIGTIRQDVNLSIKGKPRVELKGFQDLKSIPKVIEKEIERQLKLKRIKPEVRMVKKDFSTTFLRPLPGEARMYIETDVLETKLTKKDLKKIRLPELLTERALKLETRFNLAPELAKELIENKLPFSNLTKKYPRISPKLIAQILIEIPKELKTRFDINYKFKLGHFKQVLDHTQTHNLKKDAILDIFQKISKSQKINLEDYKQVSFDKLEIEIKDLIQHKPDLSPNALMGIIMKKFSGKVDPKKVFELIKKHNE